MFEKIKPGHVLRFGVDPATIVAPRGVDSAFNDNKLETKWTGVSNLGDIQLISHASGVAGDVGAQLADKLRTGTSVSRAMSYSAVGRAVTAADRVVDRVASDFVAYCDGQSNYTESERTVVSKDFSGCLMVVYQHGGHRRVAHAATSQVPQMDCKQAFLTTLQGMGATLIGWFRPFTLAESGRKADAYHAISKYIGKIDDLVSFGAVTGPNVGYAFDAFQPKGGRRGDWVVTFAREVPMNRTWNLT